MFLEMMKRIKIKKKVIKKKSSEKRVETEFLININKKEIKIKTNQLIC